MGQFYAILRNTVLETVRQPLYALVMVLQCFVILITPLFSAQVYTFGAGSGMEHSAERMMADMGLSTVLLAGLVLSVFAATSVISNEIENKTALTVLTKNISRTGFIFAKYIGVAISVGLAVVIGFITNLLSIRIGAKVAASDPVDWYAILAVCTATLLALFIATFRNYFRGRPWIGSFTLSFIACTVLAFLTISMFDADYNFILSSPDKKIEFAAENAPKAGEDKTVSDKSEENLEPPKTAYDWEVAKAGLMTMLAIWVVCSVSVAASTRLNTGGNLTVTSLVFAAGMTSQYIAYELEDFVTNRLGESMETTFTDDILLGFCNILKAFTPNMQFFWMSEALTREKAIPWSYVGSASLFALFLILAMLFLASFLFQKREVS